MMRFAFLLVFIAVIAFAPVKSVRAEPNEDARTEREQLDEQLRPEHSQDIAPALTTMRREARRATTQLAVAAGQGVVDDSLERLRTLIPLYEQQVTLAIDRTFGPRRLKEAREDLVTLDNDISELLRAVSEDVDAISELQQRWLRHRQHWQSIPRLLAEDPNFSELMPQVSEAMQAIDTVLARMPEIVPARVEQQRALLDMHGRAQDMLERIDRELSRTHPLAPSSRHLPMYAREFWSTTPPRFSSDIAAESLSEFAKRSAFVLLIHALIYLGLLIVARRLRRAQLRAKRRVAVLEHPFAIAALLTTAVSFALYHAMPAAFESALILVFAASGVLTARGATDDHRAQRGAFALAAVYSVLLVADLLAFPYPGMRVLVFACTVLLAGFVARVTWSSTSTAGVRPIGALLVAALLICAVANAAGYITLSRYLLSGLFDTGVTLLVLIVAVTVLEELAEVLRTGSKDDDRPQWRQVLGLVGGRLARLAELFLVLGGLLVVLSDWGVVESAREALSYILTRQFHVLKLEISSGRIVGAVLTVYVAIQVAAVFQLLLELTLLNRDGWEPGLINSTRTLVRYSIVGLGVLISLAVLGLDPSTLAFVGGALGVGVGFGLQNVVADFVSGLLLLFERPLRKGDTLFVQDSWGTVKHIGLRSTTIRLLDESELIVPNGHLTSEKIRNWTLSSRSARLFCPVGVAYGSDLERAFSGLREAAVRTEGVLRRPEPEVLFLAFGASSLDLELRVWVASASRRFQIQSELLRSIDAKFREDNVEIAFPQRDIHVRTLPASLRPPGTDTDAS